MPLFSIIIPSYNQLHSLTRLLTALERDPLVIAEAEVCVSDDGSTDFTQHFLNNYKGPLTVRFISSPVNRGRSHTRNAALKEAIGAFFILLDGDMEPCQDWFLAYKTALTQNSDTVFIGKFSPPKELLSDSLARYRASRGPEKLAKGAPLPAKYFRTGNTAFSRKWIDKCGLFNESYTAYGGEDIEMGFNLKRAGARFAYLPEAHSYHYHPDTLISFLRKMHQYAAKSLPILISQCPEYTREKPLLWFYAPPTIKRVFLGLFFWPPLRTPVRELAAKLPDLFAFRLFDYLIGSVLFSHLSGKK